MILKLNLKFYSSEKSLFFDAVIACQTSTPSTSENFNVLRMLKSQPLLMLHSLLNTAHYPTTLVLGMLKETGRLLL